MNLKALSISAALLLTTVVATAAGAQEMGAGSMEAMSPSSMIGPDQDSLLPPEVVPLDPRAASAMSANQGQSRQQANSTGAMPSYTGNVPGLQEMSAQDMRRQAFESLYGQGQPMQQQQMQQMQQQQMQQMQQAQQPQQVWRAGQQQPPMDPAMAMQQPPGLVGGAAQSQYPMPIALGNAPQEAPPAQSQTLTGGPKNQPVKRDILRKGFSNVFSAATTFGAGALTSAVLMKPNNPWLGAGYYGMSMTGLGNRNGFRF